MNILEQLGASGDARVDAAARHQDGRYLRHEERLMREAIRGRQRSSEVIRGVIRMVGTSGTRSA